MDNQKRAETEVADSDRRFQVGAGSCPFALVGKKGVLRPLEPLDLPEHIKLTVTVSVPKAGEHAVSAQPRFHQPTRSQPLSQLEPLIGKMPAGGDALKDSEALYDTDW